MFAKISSGLFREIETIFFSYNLRFPKINVELMTSTIRRNSFEAIKKAFVRRWRRTSVSRSVTKTYVRDICYFSLDAIENSLIIPAYYRITFGRYFILYVYILYLHYKYILFFIFIFHHDVNTSCFWATLFFTCYYIILIIFI